MGLQTGVRYTYLELFAIPGSVYVEEYGCLRLLMKSSEWGLSFRVK